MPGFQIKSPIQDICFSWGLLEANNWQQIGQFDLLDEWQISPAGYKTQLRANENTYWLSCDQVGAISFELSSHTISTYPKSGVSSQDFERVLAHEWLPLVYQAWGYQVLHASAALRLETGAAVAFAGDTGAGKSTLGYALGHRPGWEQIADDALAFSFQEEQVHLHPIPNAVRLRPDSAAYFDEPTYSHATLTWPENQPELGHIFFIQPETDIEEAGLKIEKLSGTQAYPLLLKQAYTLTLTLPGHNQRLLRDYLKLADKVPAYLLYSPQAFSSLDNLLDSIESEIK